MYSVGHLEAQIRRLTAELDEANETIRQLRAATLSPDPLPPGLPYMTRREETVFRALYFGKGLLSQGAIYDQIYQGGDRVGEDIVRVFISHLRRKLAHTQWQIATVHGRGWRLLNEEKLAA